MRIRYILYILYFKVYNSSCSQVGHDLIDRVRSLPEQIKIQLLFASTLCVTMEVLHALAYLHRCTEHGLSDRVLPINSLSCIPCNIEYMG